MREGSPPHTCHVSHVTCHMCHNILNLVGGGSVINGAYPIYFVGINFMRIYVSSTSEEWLASLTYILQSLLILSPVQTASPLIDGHFMFFFFISDKLRLLDFAGSKVYLFLNVLKATCYSVWESCFLMLLSNPSMILFHMVSQTSSSVCGNVTVQTGDFGVLCVQVVALNVVLYVCCVLWLEATFFTSINSF